MCTYAFVENKLAECLRTDFVHIHSFCSEVFTVLADFVLSSFSVYPQMSLDFIVSP